MAYEELKARQSVVWGNGPYQRITETIIDIHEQVVERLDPEPGKRWLDLATGTGAVAERAADAGASVTGIDLAPALIETAKERADERGLEIEYFVGDCERLELADGSFDVVSSTCGVMFAPDHAAVAGELSRVTAPGGRIALANWTPTSGLADLFRIMGKYQPSPPPSSPFDWGDEDESSELLGENFDLELETHVLHRCASTPARRTGSSSRRPTGRRRHSWRRSESGARSSIETGSTTSRTNHRTDDGVVHEREYLLVLGVRR